MKINRLYIAIISLSLPSAILALGMGNIKIDSSLNQPFNAEIPLIDVDSIPLDGIKVGIASQESFDHAGIKQSDILALLRFKVKKNIKNEPVISIVSEERITEPYLELVIDLAWSKGQLYRVYTVLLDPPGYNLTTYHIKKPVYRLSHPIYHQAGVINKPVYTQLTHTSDTVSQRHQSVYGPTRTNENIWQIAQRYVTADTTLPQVILAIIGTNSQAFTQGNLNGLKIGEYLRIPSNQEVAKVPIELAKQEVEAHDTAWKLQQEITHQLLPPYIDGLMGRSQFSSTDHSSNLNSNLSVKNTKPIKTKTALLPLPEATSITHENNKAGLPLLHQENSSSLSPIQRSVIQPIGSQFSYLYPVKTVKQSEKEITSTVINTVESEDNRIIDQKKYQKLQQKMIEQSQSLIRLRQQIASMNHSKLPANLILSDKNTPMPEHKKHSLLWLYLLLIATGVIGAGSFCFWRWLVTQNAQALENQNPLIPTPMPPLGAATNLSLNTYPVLLNTDDPITTINNPSDHPIEALSIPIKDANPAFIPSKDDQPIIKEASRSTVSEESDLSSNALKLRNDNQCLPLSNLAYETIKTTPTTVLNNPTKDNSDVPIESNMPPHVLEFEPGLDKMLSKDPSSPALVEHNAGIDFFVLPEMDNQELPQILNDNVTKKDHDISLLETDEAVLNASFITKEPGLSEKNESTSAQTLPSVDDKTTNNSSQDLVKSKAALTTLLELAKTYVSMEDFETATESLQEVMTFGDEELQKEAQKLLDIIKLKGD